MKKILTLIWTILAFISYSFSQNLNEEIPIHCIKNKSCFLKLVRKITPEKNTLYVFDIDNTILITNENGFGSDWWFDQSGKDPNLRLNIPLDSCLFNVLTPLFYSVFSTTPLFTGQGAAVIHWDKIAAELSH